MDTTFHYHNVKEREVAKMLRTTDAFAESIQALTVGDYASPMSSVMIAQDTTYQQAIAKMLQGYKDVRHVVLVGIGGSSMGTQAVYEALKTSKSPTLTVLDSLEERSVEALSNLVKKVKNPKHIALIIISKSGTTTETLCNGDVAMQVFEKAYGTASQKQIIVIGESDSQLVQLAKKKKLHTCMLPQSIGGRYSLFTAVGMVPLTLLGIDVAELRRGAKDGVSVESLVTASQSATYLALATKKGVRVLNFFTFDDSLKTIGYWYRQLLAESIGKSQTRRGKKFKAQLLPVVSTSVDLHSTAQLFLGGYDGVVTHFVSTEKTYSADMTMSGWVSDIVTALSQKSLQNVKDAITHGVTTAYDEAKLPYSITKAEYIDAYFIGRFCTEQMVEVMCLCDALDVDAFNQPHVELYKQHMRKALM